MTAEVENTGRDEIVYELALHPYRAVGDVEAIRIHGLELTRFVARVAGMRAPVAGSGPLALAGETDRVFLDTTAPCPVDDPILRRRIRVDKRQSRTTVVWNPGPEKARAVPDIGGDAWRRFVCVEAANAGPSAGHR